MMGTEFDSEGTADGLLSPSSEEVEMRKLHLRIVELEEELRECKVWSDAGHECLSTQIKRTAELEAELEAERQRRWDGNEANSKELAECQAREAKLREAMVSVLCNHDGVACFEGSDGDRRVIDDALALPTDDTALKEAIKQAKREALLEAAERFEGTLPYNWVCADGYSNGFDVAGELRFMAEELKG
jgi:hypothetical protein